MKLSTRLRYGTRLMLELALHYKKGPVFLSQIAKKEDISEKYLSQITIPLKAAGLVNSSRGIHGGYSLNLKPQDISVKDIASVLEGDLSLVKCVKNSKACNRASLCVTQEVWGNLTEIIEQTLDSVTLDELVEKCRKKAQQGAMYSI